MANNLNRRIDAEDLSWMDPDIGITHVGVADVPKHALPATNERRLREIASNRASSNRDSLVTIQEAYDLGFTLVKEYIDAEVGALKALLAAKGIGAPGTVRVDPVIEAYVRDYCWSLEQKVDTLERQAMSYKGVYNADTSYPRGSVVTRHGSWWIAEHGIEPGEMPGHADTNWRLCVKREKAK
jgi:hypothetical protein